MKPNVSGFDGYFRMLFFIIAVIFAVMSGQWYWLIPTAILFATAAVAWCPLYAIFGINTIKHSEAH